MRVRLLGGADSKRNNVRNVSSFTLTGAMRAFLLLLLVPLVAANCIAAERKFRHLPYCAVIFEHARCKGRYIGVYEERPRAGWFNDMGTSIIIRVSFEGCSFGFSINDSVDCGSILLVFCKAMQHVFRKARRCNSLRTKALRARNDN